MLIHRAAWSVIHDRQPVTAGFGELTGGLLQTPFASAAARARGHAALGGQPLLAGRAVHIVKGAGAKQSHDGAVALTQIALAHGAKVGHIRMCFEGGYVASILDCRSLQLLGWLLGSGHVWHNVPSRVFNAAGNSQAVSGSVSDCVHLVCRQKGLPDIHVFCAIEVACRWPC